MKKYASFKFSIINIIIFKLTIIKPLVLLLTIASLFAISVGCSTDIPMLSSNTEQSHAKAERFMELARGAKGNAALEYRLRAAESFIQADQIEAAGQVFREVQISEETNNSDLQNKMLEARLALLKQDSPYALLLIKNMLDSLAESHAALPSATLSGGTHTYNTRENQHLQKTKKIALLLPSKGPHADAAKTIREGFFAGFYKAQEQGREPSIKVYDTDNGKSVETAYSQAIADNADMIVGPLTKTEVQTIVGLSSRNPRVPVLALNSVNGKSTDHIYQFGLMPEDEIYALAEYAKQKGHHRAMVIAPSTDLGQRMTKVFTQAWTAQGGQVAQTVILKNAIHEEMSATIQAALQTQTQVRSGSRQAKNKKQAEMLTENARQGVKGKNVRQDVDMIFLAALSPDLGRKIKPLISFYGYASLPVYATASIYSGVPMPNKDHDLEGICFCDMPWVLNNTQDEAWKSAAKSSIANKTQNPGNSPRYFALGLDAFRLAQQLDDMRFLSSGGAPGATGHLFLDNQRIQRRLSCAKFINGVPTAHP